ncbi:MAG: hypothetical protein AB7H80_06610 [Candidatus Kapaibacterium sp.]
MVRITLFLALLFPISLFAQSSWEKLPPLSGSDGADHVVIYNGTIYSISHLGSSRSVDSGQSWVQTSNPPIAVTTLLVDSTGMLIAGGSAAITGQQTLYYSRDGGGDWSRADGLTEPIKEGTMVIDQDGSWLLTSNAFPLRRSRNRGETWEEVSLPLDTGFTYLYSTIARFPDNRLAISFGNSSTEGYQFMSTDGGENWMLRDSTPVYRFIPISENIYYTIRYTSSGSNTYLQREENDGTKSDRQLSTISAPKTYHFARGSGDTLYVIAWSPRTWLVSRPYLYRSPDLGVTWESADAFSNVNLQDIAVVGERVLVFGTGGPFSSTDGGTTWQVSNRGTSRYSVQNLQVAPADKGHYMVGGTLAVIEKFSQTPDDHHAWINPVEVFIPPLLALTGDGSLFVSSQVRELWRLNPGGTTFSPVEVPYRNESSSDPDESAGTIALTIGAVEYGGRNLLLLGLNSGGVDAYDVEKEFWYTFPRPNDYDAIHPIRHLTTTNEYIFTEVDRRIYRLAAKDLVENQQDPSAWEEVLKVPRGVVSMNGTRTGKILIASYDTLFLSHDGGETWDHIPLPQDPNGFSLPILKAFVTSIGRIYVSTLNNGAYVFRLNTAGSGGEGWYEEEIDAKSKGGVTSFAESRDGELYVVANQSTIYRAERPSGVEETTFREAEQVPTLTIAPNPVGVGGSIEIGSTLQGDALRITDLLGREIATLPVTTTESLHVETGTLSPGAYVVELLWEGKKVAWNMVRVIR